jgi:hypothetical protein
MSFTETVPASDKIELSYTVPLGGFVTDVRISEPGQTPVANFLMDWQGQPCGGTEQVYSPWGDKDVWYWNYEDYT